MSFVLCSCLEEALDDLGIFFDCPLSVFLELVLFVVFFSGGVDSPLVAMSLGVVEGVGG